MSIALDKSACPQYNQRMSHDHQPEAPHNLPSEEPKKEHPAPHGAEAHPEHDQPSGLFSNSLVIIALAIIAVIILWGLVHFLTLSGSWFSSFVPHSTPSVQVTVPKGISSGSPLEVTWKYETSTSGEYSIVYQCGSHVRLSILRGNNALEPFACGAAFPIGTTTSATIIPQLTSTTPADLLLSIVFTPSTGGTPAEGTATVTVTPTTGAAKSNEGGTTALPIPVDVSGKGPIHIGTNPSTALTVPAQTAASKPVAVSVGSADLSVTIIAAGYIDPSSGALLTNRPPMPGDTVGVEFDIRNNGPRATGAWRFEAHLPTQSPYTYTSPVQRSLQPGDHIVNTLRFTMLSPGGGLFTVIADPSQQVADPNRANNEAAVTVY